MEIDRIRLPFAEQISFFRQKLNLPTERWDDIQRSAHDRAFVVAGAQQADLLDDLRQAVDGAIARGDTLADFRKNFQAIIERRGWADFHGDDRATQGRSGGRALAWRTRTIYQTNIATSYAAGRWQQLNDPALLGERPYWRYIHSDLVSNPRPLHKRWGDSGLTLRHDDPFWQTHFPPNGWGCFPGETPVRCDALIGQRFVYTGKLVEFETRLGYRLALTPNHPVLTSKGWIAAGALQAGYEVLTAVRHIDTALHGIVDDPQPPALAENLFEALAAQGLRIVPMAADDFHGDALGGKGEVYIAGTDGSLMDVIEAAPGQFVGEGGFNPALHRGIESTDIASGSALCAQRIENSILAQDATDGGFGQLHAARDGSLAQQPGSVHGQHLSLGLGIEGVSSVPGSAEVALSLATRLDPNPARGHAFATVADRNAPQLEDTAERGTADAKRFGQLLEANPGLILRDEIRFIRQFDFSGHVFDFTTTTGLIMAGGVVVSNCRCRVKAVRAPASGDTTAPPAGWDTRDGKGNLPGVDKNWDYAPGASLSVFSPPLLDDTPSGTPLFKAVCPDGGKAALTGKKCPGSPPRPRPFDPARLLPDGRNPEWYVAAFLDQFGATIEKPVLFIDVNGDPLIVSDALFIDVAKSARARGKVYKAMKRDRHRRMLMLADTLKHPQEKWDAWEYVNALDETIRRVRYLAWWEIDAAKAPGLSVFEWVHKRWWSGVTTFAPDGSAGFSPEEYMDRQRVGVRRWPK